MNDTLLDDLEADGFGHYLAGFIDGEGCFYISFQRLVSKNGTYSCGFTINLRSDDLAILEQARVRLGGIGTLITVPLTENLSRGVTWVSKPKVHWQVRRRVDCLVLCAVLDRFPLRAKKARDYAIWRAAVHHWEAIEPRPGIQSDWTRIAELKCLLETGKTFAGALVLESATPESAQISLIP